MVKLETEKWVRSISVHPDGLRIAAWIDRPNHDLCLLEGFPTPTTDLERLFRKWTEPK